MLALLDKAREAAHSAIAVIGAVAGFQGLIVACLSQFGLHISAAQVSYTIGGIGTGVALLSKAVDSLNDAWKARKASAK